MFTGIIEEIGLVKSFEKYKNGAKLIISANNILENTKIGDSICVDGVCQTVCEVSEDAFGVMLSDETLRITNFDDKKTGDLLNLERALTLQTRLGGHIVSGHVDCVGTVKNVEKLSEFYNLVFEIPEKYSKYVVLKGSITINGVSLTVANITGNLITIAVIPHTFNNTNLNKLKIGSIVNIETDILSKYVEKLLLLNDNKEKSSISLDFLKENGFV